MGDTGQQISRDDEKTVPGLGGGKWFYIGSGKKEKDTINVVVKIINCHTPTWLFIIKQVLLKWDMRKKIIGEAGNDDQ